MHICKKQKKYNTRDNTFLQKVEFLIFLCFHIFYSLILVKDSPLPESLFWPLDWAKYPLFSTSISAHENPHHCSHYTETTYLVISLPTKWEFMKLAMAF